MVSGASGADGVVPLAGPSCVPLAPRCVVRGLSIHGPEVVAALTHAFEKSGTMPRMYWPPDVVRDVVTALWEAGAGAAWTHRRLTLLEPDLFADDEIQGRLKSAQAQFDSYVSVRDLQSARQVYTDLLRASLGVGYKDYQVIGLLRWVELANREDPPSGAARIAAAASFMPPLEGTHAEWNFPEGGRSGRLQVEFSSPAAGGASAPARLARRRAAPIHAD